MTTRFIGSMWTSSGTWNFYNGAGVGELRTPWVKRRMTVDTVRGQTWFHDPSRDFNHKFGENVEHRPRHSHPTISEDWDCFRRYPGSRTNAGAWSVL